MEDPPNQESWQHDGVLGYAGFKIADSVKAHELWGGGSYIFTNVDPTIHATQGFEVPNTPGVVLHDLLSVQLGAGTLDHVINGKGLPVSSAAVGIPSYVVLYPSDDATPPTVTITDDVPDATATGELTFTFTFSEDVGTSITTSDIALSGGTKGAFTRVDALHATLLVAPTVNATGTIEISVAAETFADLAGNVNTDATTAQQDYDTTPPVDTTPPTVVISDDVAGAIATGDVRFTFAFSEDVGTSFTVDDVVLTGGTKGAFTRVNALTATLVARPPVDTTGTLAVSVAAGAFTDLAGNASTVAASAQQDYVTPSAPTGLLITFDEATPPVLTDFGSAQSAIVADPANAANKVARTVKASGAATWAGTTVSTLSGDSVPVIALTATSSTMTARVWSPDAGIPVRLKVEDATNNTHTAETQVTTTVAGAWETLTFDFANVAPGTEPLHPEWSFTRVSIFYDFGTEGTGKTFYLDDLTGPAGGGGGVDTTPPTVVISDDVAGATATGDVRFTFAFSEDVGTSFTVEDVVLTGGTKGAFARVDAFTATLVARPPADATGTLEVSVAAGAFADLAGNASTVAASATQDYVTPLPFVITFDEVTPPVLTGFWGADGAVVADPTDPANMVGRSVKLAATAAFYAGTTVSTGPDQSVPVMPFTATRAVVTMRVYSAAAGIRVRMKVENALNPGINCETDAFTTVAGAWETLTFDFYDTSTHYIPNGPTTYDLTKPTASLNAANTYNKVSVFYDYGRGGSGYAPMTEDQTWYFDDIGI